jgi:hypothetical protein
VAPMAQAELTRRPGAASGGTGPGARRIGKGAAAMVEAVQQVMVGRASTLRREAAVHSNVQAMRFGIIR